MPREIARQPRLGGTRRRRIGIFHLDQHQRLAQQPFGRRLVAPRFGDRGEFAQRLRAQPRDRRDAALAHPDQRRHRLGQQPLRGREIALLPRHGARDLHRLRIQDLAALERGERGRVVAGDAAHRIGIDLGRGRQVDDRGAGGRHDIGADRRHRPGELGRGGVELALVDQVQRDIVAAQAKLDGVVRRDQRELAEQRVGLVELAEIGALQRAVGDIFAEQRARRGIVAPRVEHVEELGRIGVVAGIVVAIGFRQHLPRIEHARLHARERARAGHRRRRHRDLARHAPVGNERAQAELERAVIAVEPFGDIGHLAAGQRIDAIADALRRHPAVARCDAGQIGDLRGRRRTAADVGAARRIDSRDRLRLRAAQREQPAHRGRGVAADDRIAAIEHALDGTARGAVLRATQHARSRSDAKTVEHAGRQLGGARHAPARQRQHRGCHHRPHLRRHGATFPQGRERIPPLPCTLNATRRTSPDRSQWNSATPRASDPASARVPDRTQR